MKGKRKGNHLLLPCTDSTEFKLVSGKKSGQIQNDFLSSVSWIHYPLRECLDLRTINTITAGSPSFELCACTAIYESSIST